MAKHLRIVGVVQGVGYRASFTTQARRLGLSGWVRNRIDGSVEALVQGNEHALTDILAWARRGPPAARVRDITITDVDDNVTPHADFSVLPTE